MIFKAGDIVTCAFFEGQHTLLKEGNRVLRIQYKYYGNLFDREEKVFSLHDKPVLTLARRSKKMVKKEFDVWIADPVSNCVGSYCTQESKYYKTKAKLIYEIESEE